MDFNGILLEFISLNGFSMDLQRIFNGVLMDFNGFQWNFIGIC